MPLNHPALSDSPCTIPLPSLLLPSKQCTTLVIGMNLRPHWFLLELPNNNNWIAKVVYLLRPLTRPSLHIHTSRNAAKIRREGDRRMVTKLQGGIGSREGGSCVICLEWYLGQLVLDLIVVGKGWVDLAGGLVRGVEGWWDR